MALRLVLLGLLLSKTVFGTELKFPYTPGLDLTAMDQDIQPCRDFYRYACGGWIKKNPIPPDQAAWDVYSKLSLENETFIRALLEEAAKSVDTRAPAQRKIGDFYASCMGEGAIESAGLGPIADRLQAIEKIKSMRDMTAVLAREHTRGVGLLFQIGAEPDYADSHFQLAFAIRGDLGLPDRDYYLKTDKKSREIRERYRTHLTDTFLLLGDEKPRAKKNADEVLRLETQLARAMLSREAMRDPRKLFHKMKFAKFRKMLSQIEWDSYLREAGLDPASSVNVTEPEYFAALARGLKATPLEAWRAMMRFQLLHESAPYLSKKFAEANFAFYGRYLYGVQEQRPRWRRCAMWTDELIGEALGQVFVEKTFSPETKARTLTLATQVEEAMAGEIQSLPWMGAATKRRALEKLHALVNKIGYPEKWRDYSALEIQRGDFFANVERAGIFEVRRIRGKIGKPVDRNEWHMTPPTVNAYYSPQTNDVNFPAGILQPPLFDPKMDDAPNFGNTGSTIGHELTHGFDDEGRRFDANGNLRDWWTKKDAKEFEKRARCLSDQYSSYIAVDDLHINGKLTNGEDIADLGGTRLAYLAWKRASEGKTLSPRDGLTPEQRFFVGMAQWACGDIRKETRRDLAISDPHSPPEFRINGVVANMPEFAQAFSCKKGDAMVREKPCRVW